jgi:hypothetical protein
MEVWLCNGQAKRLKALVLKAHADRYLTLHTIRKAETSILSSSKVFSITAQNYVDVAYVSISN